MLQPGLPLVPLKSLNYRISINLNGVFEFWKVRLDSQQMRLYPPFLNVPPPVLCTFIKLGSNNLEGTKGH